MTSLRAPMIEGAPSLTNGGSGKGGARCAFTPWLKRAAVRAAGIPTARRGDARTRVLASQDPRAVAGRDRAPANARAGPGPFDYQYRGAS
jgi:hypothetical protein